MKLQSSRKNNKMAKEDTRSLKKQEDGTYVLTLYNEKAKLKTEKIYTLQELKKIYKEDLVPELMTLTQNFHQVNKELEKLDLSAPTEVDKMKDQHPGMESEFEAAKEFLDFAIKAEKANRFKQRLEKLTHKKNLQEGLQHLREEMSELESAIPELKRNK